MLTRTRWIVASYVMVNEETTEHFLITCPALANKRVKYLQTNYWLLFYNDVPMPKDAQELRQQILTPATIVHGDLIPAFEQMSQRFFFKLHSVRSATMGGEATCIYSSCLPK